jgi:SAM-dependent methyltransferase
MERDNRHNIEIHTNKKAWDKKPTLRDAYKRFHELIKENLSPEKGPILELGSGMGNIKKTIPTCITSDIHPNPWLDSQENAYHLSFPNASLSNLILFDVWHHLEYPANALEEAKRVLKPKGKLLIFEPAMSFTGLVIYGCLHPEPLGLRHEFQESILPLKKEENKPYFAAQASAQRLLIKKEIPSLLKGWKTPESIPITSFEYLATGGFQAPCLYPLRASKWVENLDNFLQQWPKIFAARVLVTLEKA